MGMEVFNPSRYSIGLNSNIQLNNFGKMCTLDKILFRIVFKVTHRFNCLMKAKIKKLISQNPDVKKNSFRKQIICSFKYV